MLHRQLRQIRHQQHCLFLSQNSEKESVLRVVIALTYTVFHILTLLLKVKELYWNLVLWYSLSNVDHK